jgi:general secretion pathway protein D
MIDSNRTVDTMSLTRIWRLAVLAFLIVCPGLVVANSVHMNFRDADIRSVIESVAEITGRSFVIDPRVKGKLTIISPVKIDADLLYEVFLSALQVHGYQAVQDGAVVRIVPTSQSFQLPTGGEGNELVTRVLPVRHGKAADMVPLLRSILTQGAQLQAYATSNRLVVTDTRAQVARLEKVLASVDIPENQTFEVVNLENMSSTEAMRILI